VVLEGLWHSWGQKKWSRNGIKVMFAMHRLTIGPCMKSMVENYFHHLRLCVQSFNQKLSSTTPFNGLMVVWVSMIVFWSIPTCISIKCAINLRPKVWYNMKLKNKFHITKMNNRTSYQIWSRWFWIFGIFAFSCGGYPFINVPLHQGIFMVLFII
jgi:hypothetical protein